MERSSTLKRKGETRPSRREEERTTVSMTPRPMPPVVKEPWERRVRGRSLPVSSSFRENMWPSPVRIQSTLIPKEERYER